MRPKIKLGDLEEIPSKVKSKIYHFRREFRKQTVTAIIAAFAFLIALSWRDFIVEIVNKIVKSLGTIENAYLFKLLSAVLVTFLSIIGIAIVLKFQIKKEEREKIEEEKNKRKTTKTQLKKQKEI